MKTYSQLLVEARSDSPIIMLDMDGVVADYARGVKELCGMSIEDWKDRCKKMTDSKGNVPPEVSNNKLHKMVTDSGIEFWENLNWMKDGKQLWSFLKNHDVEILSAYKKKRNDPKGYSHDGKLLWLDRNMRIPKNKINLVMREDKQKYALNAAGKPNILVDDYIKNIKEFEAAGGIGVHHTSASKTIAKLKKLGFV